MTSPDSELRLLSALQRSEGTEEEKQRRKKIINDLKQGFRIRSKAPPTDCVYVATRFGEDLFEVQLGIDRMMVLPKDPSFDLDSFLYYEAIIRRVRKSRPRQVADVLESWEMHTATLSPLQQSFDQGLGELNGEEFWRRYEGSVVDPAATQEFYKNLTPESNRRDNYQMTWISEESSITRQHNTVC